MTDDLNYPLNEYPEGKWWPPTGLGTDRDQPAPDWSGAWDPTAIIPDSVDPGRVG
jgi:hypothetical protein